MWASASHCPADLPGSESRAPDSHWRPARSNRGWSGCSSVDLDWSDRLNHAQHFADGLSNKETTGQHCSEATQPDDDSSCNTSGVGLFSFSLFSAGNHLSCCDEPVLTQVAAWFQQSTESLQIFGAAHRQGGEGELPPLIGSHVWPKPRETCLTSFLMGVSCWIVRWPFNRPDQEWAEIVESIVLSFWQSRPSLLEQLIRQWEGCIWKWSME